MNNLAQLPIVLRRESFGGVLFDPADATFLELDHEGFNLLSEFSHSPDMTLDEPAHDLLDEVRSNLTRFDGRAFRHIAVDTVPDATPLPVLSAPSLVDFQITDQCHLECPHCYASSTSDGQHGKLDDIFLALQQIADVGAFQVAIGGGEPLLHPQLDRILERCHELGLVPNLTTSGLQLNEHNLELIRHYCGAVGVSLEGVGGDFDQYRKTGFPFFRKSLAKLAEYQIPTVLQVTLNTETFARLDSITEFCRDQPNIYGVIFLAFKPVGRGLQYGETLAALPHAQFNARLQETFFRLSEVTRVGFDCCLTPGVTGSGSSFDLHAARYLEGCSAFRSSIGLLPNLDVLPCTFTPQHAIGNLHDTPLRELWQGLAINRFRGHMVDQAASNTSCSNCAKYGYCLGGCPVMELVNCANDYLSASRQVEVNFSLKTDIR